MALALSLYLFGCIFFETQTRAETVSSAPSVNDANPTLSSNNLAGKFDIALKYYQNKDYKNAELTFLDLLKQEPKSPEIYHNLGLTYQALDEKGRALAAFRTLTNLEPRNISAYKTIEFMETQLINKNFEHDRSFFEDLDIMFLQWVRLPELLSLHFIAFLIFGFFFTRHLALKKKMAFFDELLPLFTPKIYAGLAVVVAFTSLVLLKINLDNTPTATIIAKNKLILKSGPSENSADLYELFEGFEVTVDSSLKDWVQVTYHDQFSGWVKNNNIWKHMQ